MHQHAAGCGVKKMHASDERQIGLSNLLSNAPLEGATTPANSL